MPSAKPLESIFPIDLNFQSIPGTIAVYLIPHKNGAILVESGPGSTIPALQAGLRAHGYSPSDITDVLLTHIHLDHAGAAGWLARQGARIHVHPNGAPHLINPEKLLYSARRIFGEQMEALWGEFLPVPESNLQVMEIGQIIEIENLVIKAIDTPGHADHHFTYQLGEVIFSGDVGGVRLQGLNHVRTPMVPPELNIESWRESITRLVKLDVRYIAPTHFGFFTDPGWQLNSVIKALDDLEDWMEANLPGEPSIASLNTRFLDWIENRSRRNGLTPDEIQANETANPSWLSPLGLQRYWRKYRENR
jgi:glyoxylase-like metal-dependent hydrolase (beta-lactamase superfamily II)